MRWCALPNAVEGCAHDRRRCRSPLAAEDLSGREEDVRPVEQGVGEGVARPPVGHTGPQEHPDLARADGACRGPEEGAAGRRAGGVFGVRFLDSVAVRQGQTAASCSGRHMPEANWLAMRNIGATASDVPTAKPIFRAPAAQVALAERTAPPPLLRQERQRLNGVPRPDARVGIVVDDEDAARLGSTRERQ